jgi:hypothetical protein
VEDIREKDEVMSQGLKDNRGEALEKVKGAEDNPEVAQNKPAEAKRKPRDNRRNRKIQEKEE